MSCIAKQCTPPRKTKLYFSSSSVLTVVVSKFSIAQNNFNFIFYRTTSIEACYFMFNLNHFCNSRALPAFWYWVSDICLLVPALSGPQHLFTLSNTSLLSRLSYPIAPFCTVWPCPTSDKVFLCCSKNIILSCEKYFGRAWTTLNSHEAGHFLVSYHWSTRRCVLQHQQGYRRRSFCGTELYWFCGWYSRCSRTFKMLHATFGS